MAADPRGLMPARQGQRCAKTGWRTAGDGIAGIVAQVCDDESCVAEEEAMHRIELEPVDRVEITVLMDNVTDPLLVDQEAVARMNWPKAILGGLPTRRRA